MIDNSQLSAYHEKQAKQDSEIAVLKSRIDSVEKDLDEFKNKDKEELDQRLRSIEKQVWGAGAVIAVLFLVLVSLLRWKVMMTGMMKQKLNM